MPYSKYPLLNKNKLKTISINERHSQVNSKDFAKPCEPGTDFRTFLSSFPRLLAGRDFREFVQKMVAARKQEKPIIWGLGAHVIKVGLAPIIIDLMQRGWISAIAANGAFMIHDFEIALCSETSENVGENLHQGSYGNTQETGLFLNLALKDGLLKNMGSGEAIGYYLIQAKLPFLEQSVLFHAYKLNIPVTIHTAIGADFIHYHPMFVGEITGAMAERDFILFASIVAQLSHGGVFLNVGSNVILPEVFLKAVAFCTAQGIAMKEFCSAVFDFQHHYRPAENVARRPVANKGRGYYFIGHHELMIPLLASAILNAT